jgi:CheY-like chemotaxis protein
MIDTLLIDEEPFMRTTIRRMFEQAGHRVSEVEDGGKGIAAIEQTQFDLAVTDIIMPDMEAIITVRAIRDLRPQPPRVLGGPAQVRRW